MKQLLILFAVLIGVSSCMNSEKREQERTTIRKQNIRDSISKYVYITDVKQTPESDNKYSKYQSNPQTGSVIFTGRGTFYNNPSWCIYNGTEYTIDCVKFILFEGGHEFTLEEHYINPHSRIILTSKQNRDSKKPQIVSVKSKALGLE